MGSEVEAASVTEALKQVPLVMRSMARLTEKVPLRSPSPEDGRQLVLRLKKSSRGSVQTLSSVCHREPGEEGVCPETLTRGGVVGRSPTVRTGTRPGLGCPRETPVPLLPSRSSRRPSRTLLPQTTKEEVETLVKRKTRRTDSLNSLRKRFRRTV